MNNTFAQDNSDRIPAKGFAVFEEKGHFQPTLSVVTRLVTTIFRLKSFMRESVTVICTMYLPTGGRRSIPGFPDTKLRDVRLPSVRTSRNSS